MRLGTEILQSAIDNEENNANQTVGDDTSVDNEMVNEMRRRQKQLHAQIKKQFNANKGSNVIQLRPAKSRSNSVLPLSWRDIRRDKPVYKVEHVRYSSLGPSVRVGFSLLNLVIDTDARISHFS